MSWSYATLASSPNINTPAYGKDLRIENSNLKFFCNNNIKYNMKSRVEIN